MHHMTEYAGEYTSDISQFLCCDKYRKDNKHNSLHLTQIFVLNGHHLLLKALCSFRASLMENCSPLGTDTHVMSPDKYPSIFSCQKEAIVYLTKYQDHKGEYLPKVLAVCTMYTIKVHTNKTKGPYSPTMVPLITLG